MMGGLGIGMPPVLNFGVPGDRALQDRVVRECLAGEKIICLCITEPGAGSDVANLACTAEDKGDHFLVNGNKKWITNGIYADYFTVAVRTGPPGSAHKGLSMLLIERNSSPGITTSKMDCMGVWPSGTTYIEFDNVKVPKKNVVGRVGDGFKQIMYNFNHERWLLAAQAARMARTCVEESIAFARSRRTFGKFLIEHQAIQHKIGEMARQCEGPPGVARERHVPDEHNVKGGAEPQARRAHRASQAFVLKGRRVLRFQRHASPRRCGVHPQRQGHQG